MNFKKPILFVCFFLLLSKASFIYGLPEGENVVSGEAVFDRSTTNTLNINTPSEKLIVNYNSFNIAQAEAVNFQQPSSGAIALNRVTGADPSAIMGSLTANGRVFLINPNGVLFGPNSRVDAAALVASTLDISNEDFLKGDFNFYKDGRNGAIINQGRIASLPGGYICMLSQAIANQGIIQAGLGTVVLASGEKMTLALDDLNQISVVIDEAVKGEVFAPDGKKMDSAIKNSGTIIADGGKIILTAKVLNNAFDYAVNNSGIIQAKSLFNHDGVVELTAEGAAVYNTGKIEAGEVKAEVRGADFINAGEIKAGGKEDVFNSGNVYIQAVNVFQCGLISAKAAVTIEAENNVETSYSKTVSSGSLRESEAVNTNQAVLIQANQVKITAKQFGTRNIPLNINAGVIYINRTQGDIDILESLGIGTSILLRGPPDGFGAIIYNKDANLTLEASQVVLSGSIPAYFFGNITFFNFTCAIPDKEIYFEAGRTYTFIGAFKIQGAYGRLVKLLSQEKGSHWFIDPQGQRDLTFAWVEDSCNINPSEIIMTNSTSRTNNVNWDPDVYWIADSNGNWDAGANWSIGVVPGNMDDVYFTSSHNGNSTQNINSLTINSLTVNGYTGTITLSRNLTVINGYNQSSGIFKSNGYTFTIGSYSQSGGIFTASASNIFCNGDFFFGGGTYNANTSSITFNAASIGKTISAGSVNFNDIEFDGVGGGWSLQDNLSVNGSLTLNNGILNTNGYALTLGSYSQTGGTWTAGASVITCNGAYSVTGGTYNADSSTLILDATAGGFTFTGAGYTFNNVMFKSDSSGSGRIITLGSGTFIFLGNFYVQANGSKDITVRASANNPDVHISGDLDFTGTGSGSEIISLGSGTWTVSGNVDFRDGEITVADTSTLKMDGISKTLYGNSLTLENLCISGIITSGDNFSVSGTLSVDINKTLIIDTGKIVTMESGSITTINGTITGNGRLNLVDSAGANLSTTGILSSIVRFTTSGASVQVPARVYGGIVEFYNNSGSNRTVTLGTADSQTLDFQSNVYLIADSSKNITVTASTYNPTVNISGDIDFIGAGSGLEIIQAGSGTWSIKGNVDFTGGTFTPNTGTVILNGTTIQILNQGSSGFNNLTIAVNASVDIQDNNLSVAGIFTNNGTFRLGGDNNSVSAPTNNSGSTVEYTAASGTRVIKNWVYYNLTINGSGGTFTLPSAITLNGSLNVNAGNFDIEANRLTIIGNLNVNGGIFTAINGNIDANGDVNITGGVFTAPGISKSFSVAGSWTKAGGTFDPSAGTVIFDDASKTSTISGSTTFYNLTSTTAGKQLVFVSGSTQTITGSLILTGSSGNRISLRSSLPGTQWGIDPQGAKNVSYVDVRDSNAVSLITPAGANKDSGNNTNWYLVDHFVVSGLASMIAGNSNELTITAIDGSGGISTSYTGNKSLIFSGLGNAPSGVIPKVEGINIGSAVDVNFSNGISDAGTASLTAYKAETATVNVSDGVVNSTGYGLGLTVESA
ncbi:MAG: filamentous hemagglutinin N-terminal domain-containing protein, partial [Candidatus Omnitrophota bacterium]